MNHKLSLLTVVALALFSGCAHSDLVSISNSSASLGFDRQTGKLVSFVNKEEDIELIDQASVEGLPWRLEAADPEALSGKGECRVSFKRHGRSGLDITYAYPGDNPLEARIQVSLDKGRPMSRWRISLDGLDESFGGSVACPVVGGLKTVDNADLLMPSWLGHIVHDPSGKYSQAFPGGSVQMMALYDRESREGGLYLSSQDTAATAKSLSVSTTQTNVELKAVSIIPDKGKTRSYSLDYDVVVGIFDGDWLSAAEIYREWALDQKFCRDSRLRGGNIPGWLPKTAFWIWNRGRSDNVLKEAEDMQTRLGLPVNVYWHWWHGCPYDEGFPEYIPPKEGRESFVEAVNHAREKGIHCVVYMNSFQWGDSTESWKNENPAPYAAQREDGGNYRQVFNIFSGKGLTPMCVATQFWRDKYASLCDTVVNKYHVGGVYMDQACMSKACYNPDHGHTLGGGDYWWNGFRKLTEQIRGNFGDGADAMLTGEGSSEDWMRLLDLFMTLEPSWERYRGVSRSEPVPLFQAVYHDYAMSYGSYSSLVYPPYDELWPREYRPANAETLLPEEFNMQFRMEQARAFTWGMMPTLANYHSFLFDERKQEMDYLTDLIKTRYNALDYLLYGQMKAIQGIPSEKKKIPVSKVSIYAGRMGDTVTKQEMEVSTLYSSAWLSKDGNLGVAITNIADEPQEVSIKVEAGKYGIPSAGKVNLITSGGKVPYGEYSDGVSLHYTVPPRSNAVLEFVK